MKRKGIQKDLAFEEALGEQWMGDVVEVPLGHKPLVYLGAAIALVAGIVALRVGQLNVWSGAVYSARAEANLVERDRLPAPRGLITDRYGEILAQNKAIFTAILNVREFLKRPDLHGATLQSIEKNFRLTPEIVWQAVETAGQNEFWPPIVLKENLTQSEIISLKSENLPTIIIESGFEREYKDGPAFASIIGYTGRVSAADLKKDAELGSEDFIGRAGVEAFYDSALRGEAGMVSVVRNARGNALGAQEQRDPQIGNTLKLTVDAGLQKFFHQRLRQGLAALGRRVGLGLAINPQSGEILALVNTPTFDNNVLGGPGRDAEKMQILTSPDKPLFNRVIGGLYSPGSTIKPLVATAALAEGIIDPEKKIFSPGYLEVPNPYNPDEPTRYPDWRNQGEVNLASAIGRSSNVYFYTVGGGAGDIAGVGITKLRKWWQNFHLGKPTGVDLPGEAAGFLPSPEWKEEKTKRPWLLGDTYNVAIGQGDLLLTPLQLLSYISAIGNGGKIYQPVINFENSTAAVIEDLSEFNNLFAEIRKGMRQAVTSPLGTAHSIVDLPFAVEAKTGTAQIQNNTQANAIFVGYAPSENPQIAILVLVENSKEGSLNTLPIAKDVLNWYYVNRIQK